MVTVQRLFNVGTGAAAIKPRRRRHKLRQPAMKHGSALNTACLQFDPLGIRLRLDSSDNRTFPPSSTITDVQQGQVAHRTGGEPLQVWGRGPM